MFDYNKQPGNIVIKRKYETNNDIKISVIIPFYNDDEHIIQTVNAIINQTFPLFELLIIDDGSTKWEALDILNNIESLDPRIKVIHKSNTGVSDTRDFGASMASGKTKYFVFCDSDDLLDKTYLECGYLTLETNKAASFAYTDSVCFDSKNYLWNRYFDSEIMKYENLLVNSNMIRKDAFFSVGGYEYKEKKIYEDWNLWLKLIRDNKYPVKMNFYGSWYRVKEIGEFASSINNNHKRAMEIVNKTAKQIKGVVEAISYPRFNYIDTDFSFDKCFKYKDENELVILNDLDLTNIDNKVVISTVVNDVSVRQEIEKRSLEYFNLTTFLDQTYWNAFINYIIETRNIKNRVKFNLPDKNQYLEDCINYNRLYNYPSESMIKFFHNHLKLYRLKIKIDRFSQKHHFYNLNIKCQKLLLKLLKKKV